MFVTLYFGDPEVGIGFRYDVEAAVVVSVPEAAVDEDGCMVFSEYDVGCAGQSFDIDTESESVGEEEASDDEFGLSVLAADVAHAEVSLFSCQFVGHWVMKVEKADVHWMDTG